MIVNLALLPDKEQKKIRIAKYTKIYHLLKKLNFNPDTVIVLRNNSPVPIDERLTENDRIEILRVVSGG